MLASARTRPQMGEPADLLDLANRMLRMQNNEEAMALMLRLMLTFEDLEHAWSLPKVERHRFEFNLPGARIDLLLFHTDRSVSIVEAKAETDMRSTAAGIGQLCLYAALLPQVLIGDQSPALVRRILCAPVEPEKSLNLMRACEMAGVQFAHLPTFATFKARAEALRAC